ncbi:ParB/RepB/Spo0J family partition protein [Candidatus Parcubacteria bacterium]|nr:ParB/RepB/Spo0J family partition protein [Candidatus Parcubacteria bacterium]
MKQTFGKGIESLIPNKKQKNIEKSATKKEAVFYIEVERIKSNPYQPRREFNMDALNSLAESIREHGILQPLVVAKIETSGLKDKSMQTQYQLIAGERRLMASKIIGLKEVPVIVRHPTNKERLELSLVENVQRQDLNPIEKAEAFDRLHKEFGLTHEKIGQLAGITRPVVSNMVRFLGLSQEIKQAIRENKITEGLAKAILLTKEPQKRKVVFDKILRDNLNVREAEHLARKLNIWQPGKGVKKEIVDELVDLEMKFKELFGVTAKTIKLKLEDGRPKLTVFFDSKHEAEKLLNDLK